MRQNLVQRQGSILAVVCMVLRMFSLLSHSIPSLRNIKRKQVPVSVVTEHPVSC